MGEGMWIAEVTKLEDMLNAFYRRRREIPSFERLSDLVDMGDFYCALPTISTFVEANLQNSPGLLRDIPRRTSELLGKAIKLRSRTLFREAFIHHVGQGGGGSHLAPTREDIRGPTMSTRLGGHARS